MQLPLTLRMGVRSLLAVLLLYLGVSGRNSLAHRLQITCRTPRTLNQQSGVAWRWAALWIS